MTQCLCVTRSSVAPENPRFKDLRPITALSIEGSFSKEFIETTAELCVVSSGLQQSIPQVSSELSLVLQLTCL